MEQRVLSAEFRIDVIDAFESLMAAIDKLCQAIETDSALMAWTQHPSLAPNQHRQRACTIIRQLEYTDEQAPRETVLCAGFIGASAQTLSLAQGVNLSKERFKKSILALRSVNLAKSDPYLTEKFNTILPRPQQTAHLLQKLGLARLHLKQCYRKIPILEKAPSKISWTWAHTRAIKKITVAKAEEMLSKKGKIPAIEMQLQKLQSLSPREPLAIVQDLAPHLRANLVFQQENALERHMIKGPLPVFFPCTVETPRPQFNPPLPKQEKDATRSKRCDIKIESTPFIPAIRAHRYIQKP